MRSVSRRSFLSVAGASLILLSGCSHDDQAAIPQETTPPEEDSSSDTEPTTTSETVPVERVEEPYEPQIYEYDEAIDRYLVAYNAANPEHEIAEVVPYNHHGSTHKNQVNFNLDGFEVTVSDSSHFGNSSVDVVVIGYEADKDNDEAAQAFTMLAKGFAAIQSDEDAAAIWSEAVESTTHSTERDGVELSLTIDPLDGAIEYLTIGGGVA